MTAPVERDDAASQYLGETSVKSEARNELNTSLASHSTGEEKPDGEWLRSGALLYTLEQDGWIRGKPNFRNRLMIRVDYDARSDGAEQDAAILTGALHNWLSAPAPAEEARGRVEALEGAAVQWMVSDLALHHPSKHDRAALRKRIERALLALPASTQGEESR